MPVTRLLLLAACSAALAACGGGGDSVDTADTASGPGGSTARLQACSEVSYPGDTSNPQVFSFDAIAQFDACAFQATGDNRYVTDGNNQCQTLAGLLAATGGGFRPLFCSGSALKV